MRPCTSFWLAGLCALTLGCAPKTGDVRVLDDGVASVIRVGSVSVGSTATGTSRAWTEVQNRTARPLSLRGRVLFYGEDGAPLDISSGWRPLFLDAHSSTSFEGLSSAAGAARAIIEIQAGE